MALASGPRHGYGITKVVAQLSGGQSQLGPGTLYGALTRFVEEGIVAVHSEEIVAGRPRRYYRLNSAGRQRIVAETKRRAALARRVRAILATE